MWAWLWGILKGEDGYIMGPGSPHLLNDIPHSFSFAVRFLSLFPRACLSFTLWCVDYGLGSRHAELTVEWR